MKKILLICILSLGLAACSDTMTKFQSGLDEAGQVVKQAITPDNYDTVTALYGSAQAVLLAYRNSCQRKIIAKVCWKNIALVQPYEAKAYTAYVNLRTFIKNNPSGDSFSLVQTAKNAILAFQNAQAANGVK